MARPFRLLLAALASVLMERLRTVGLAGLGSAHAQMWTLRCRLLKIGSLIVVVSAIVPLSCDRLSTVVKGGLRASGCVPRVCR